MEGGKGRELIGKHTTSHNLYRPGKRRCGFGLRSNGQNLANRVWGLVLFGIDCDVRVEEGRLQEGKLVRARVCPGEVAGGKIRGLRKTAWLETGDKIEEICALNDRYEFGEGKVESGERLE